MKNGEKSFSKLFELLELIARTNHGISGKSLSMESGIPQSSTFRMLKFMVDHDYLRVQNGLYTLGAGFVRLGNVAFQQNPLTKIAHPILEELARQTQETVHLAKLQGDQIIYIDKVDGSRPIRMGSLIGKMNPLYCTGVGKAIFAFLGDSAIDSLLPGMEYKKFTKNTITSESEMREELQKIRERGYAVDDCEHEAGVYCLAAPILDRNGRSIAGISISGAEIYMRDQSKHLADLVVLASQNISEKL